MSQKRSNEENPEQHNQTDSPGAETPQDECETVESLIAAYSLGATDPEESELVQARLADCPQAAQELAEYTELKEAMLFSAPPVQAPPDLADKLMAAASSTADDGTRAGPSTGSSGGLAAQLGQWLAGRRWQLSPVLATLAIVLLIGSNLYWQAQLNAVRAQQAEMAERLQVQNALMVLIGAGNAQRVELPPQAEESEAHAAMVWDPDRRRAFLYVGNFPTLPPTEVYQLWLIRDDTRVSGGLFTVDDNGAGTLLLEAPEPLGTYEAVGITPEPAGGSPGPTAPPVVKGPL